MRTFIQFALFEIVALLPIVGCNDRIGPPDSNLEKFIASSADFVSFADNGDVLVAVNSVESYHVPRGPLDTSVPPPMPYTGLRRFNTQGHQVWSHSLRAYGSNFVFTEVRGFVLRSGTQLMIAGHGYNGLMWAVMDTNGHYDQAHFRDTGQIFGMQTARVPSGLAVLYSAGDDSAETYLEYFGEDAEQLSGPVLLPFYYWGGLYGLSNGNLLSVHGQAQEVNPQGQIVWETGGGHHGYDAAGEDANRQLLLFGDADSALVVATRMDNDSLSERLIPVAASIRRISQAARTATGWVITGTTYEAGHDALLALFWNGADSAWQTDVWTTSGNMSLVCVASRPGQVVVGGTIRYGTGGFYDDDFDNTAFLRAYDENGNPLWGTTFR